MADRKVTKSGKDDNGNINSICNGTESWSPRSKANAISDIENGTHTYYVEVQTPRAVVKVVNRSGVKHLQTVSDSNDKNNLKTCRIASGLIDGPTKGSARAPPGGPARARCLSERGPVGPLARG